jgi:LuxR family maltose regulon positive regulatory protein
LLNAGDLEAAEARLGDAEQWLDTSAGERDRPDAALGRGGADDTTAMIIVDDAQFRNLPASIATARAYLAQARGQLPATITYGRRALDLVPEADYLRRGPAAALLGLAQWASGDLEAAYRSLADAMIGFQKVGSLHFATSVTSGLADIRTVQGRLHEAIRCYTQAMRLVLVQGTPPIRGTANLYVGLSELSHEQGQREVAIQHLRRAEELGDQAGLPDWRYRMSLAQAHVTQSHGDLAGALDLLDDAEGHYRRTPVPDLRPLAALRARVWLAQGRLRDARRWAQEQGLSSEDALSFLREFAHITLARVLIAEDMHAPVGSPMREAIHLLDRLQHAAEAGGRSGSVIEIGVVQALAHQAQGDLAPALAALERALRLAEPEGYIRIFVDEGLPMAHLLRAAATRGIRPDYTDTLLAAFPERTNQAPVQNPRPSALSPQPLVEPLSERELDVLRLLGTELSGPEIAGRLMVSLNTMRTHTKHIYTKLGVTNRRAAVQRAEELDLV